MRINEEFEMEIHWFCKDIDVPVNLIVDAHQYQTSIDVNRLRDQVGRILKILE